MLKLKPGNLVRVSYRDGHTGRVLAVTDPRAWEHTAQFSYRAATPDAVAQHVTENPPDGKRTPILWSFDRVYWEPTDQLIGEYGPDNEIERDQRVELHPGCDLWMAGARFGTVIEKRPDGYRVKLDATARAATVPADRLRVLER
jgi:hypothetical protein